ncbi:hypothetical protein CDAR_376591 [Caerostris darwini]|uniref:Uncharacterized protein n=1 Tax=Caerostris darwini TaxID=1538125 RepID=A0AAV4RAH3_9ARAC|nr:hypothetical protein CDAR_376591 [Caerostris darwini]
MKRQYLIDNKESSDCCLLINDQNYPTYEYSVSIFVLFFGSEPIYGDDGVEGRKECEEAYRALITMGQQMGPTLGNGPSKYGMRIK